MTKRYSYGLSLEYDGEVEAWVIYLHKSEMEDSKQRVKMLLSKHEAETEMVRLRCLLSECQVNLMEV